MGNSTSKPISKAVPKNCIKPSTIDESTFGRQIMQNIKLKEYPFFMEQKSVSNLNGLKKRIELNQQTEDTVSWNELPLIFSEHNSKLKIDKNKMEEISKNFSFSTDKQVIKK